MKRSLLARLVLVLVLSISLSGCASTKTAVGDFFGFGIHDLEAARATGITRTYQLSCDAAFDKVLAVANAASLTVYKAERKRGVIVVMGLPKQVDTTLIGIFFESVDANTTKITLSSLSSTALKKANSIIFGGMDAPPKQPAATPTAQ